MTDTKKLAEKAVKFLGVEYDVFWTQFKVEVGYRQNISGLFFHSHYAPILAHLAKREMEKRGFKYLTGHTYGTDSVTYMAKMLHRKTEMQESYEEHENEYIALWLAIEQTGVMDG